MPHAPCTCRCFHIGCGIASGLFSWPSTAEAFTSSYNPCVSLCVSFPFSFSFSFPLCFPYSSGFSIAFAAFTVTHQISCAAHRPAIHGCSRVIVRGTQEPLPPQPVRTRQPGPPPTLRRLYLLRLHQQLPQRHRLHDQVPRRDIQHVGRSLRSVLPSRRRKQSRDPGLTDQSRASPHSQACAHMRVIRGRPPAWWPARGSALRQGQGSG